MVMTFAETGKLDWFQLIGITGFVRQLLLFYLVFWAACQLASRFVAPSYRKRVLYGAVMLLILVVYAASFVLTIPLWPVESVGFLLGMLLAHYKNKVSAFFQKKWLAKCVVAGVASAILGLMYIKMKHVVFAIGSLHGGGAERVVSVWASALAETILTCGSGKWLQKKAAM